MPDLLQVIEALHRNTNWTQSNRGDEALVSEWLDEQRNQNEEADTDSFDENDVPEDER